MALSETTRQMAAFASGLDLSSVPDQVIERVKILFADSLASALSGWSSEQSAQLAEAVRGMYGGGEATVVGSSPTSPAAACLINGYLVTARSACDVHQPTLCHVMPVAMPAVLASAEAEAAGGSDVIAALVVGAELTTRIGLGLVYETFRSRGWHSPGVSGLIGATAGVSRVLGHDVDQMEMAMGVAGGQAGGTFGSFGTPTIKFQQSRAAQAALLSATVVDAGFHGPLGILTKDDGGVFTTFSDGGDPAVAVDGLGLRWELMEITMRMWPAAAALQSVLTIVASADTPSFDEIEHVEVALPSDGFAMHGEMGWEAPFEAMLSAPYLTSYALRGASFWDFSATWPHHPSIAAFAAERVSVTEDSVLADGAGRLAVTAGDGERVWERAAPLGSPMYPPDWDHIEEKLHAAGDGVLGAAVITELAWRLRVLEDLENIRDVTGLLGV